MTEIHPTAVISKGAEIGEGAIIGPYCVIGEHVRVGAGVRLHGHVVLSGHAEIGAGCEIYPFAAIGGRSQDLKSRSGGFRVAVGEDTVLREYVTIHSPTGEGGGTLVGARCLLMAGAHVAHDCLVGNEVIIANSSALAGHVVVEDCAILGGLCGVHQFARLGRLCIVGGCSKVTKDVPPFMMADGHPLEIVGPNRVGLQRHGVPEETRRRLKWAFRLLYREGLSRREALERIDAEIPKVAEIEHLIAFCRATQRGLT